jgi:hypothetical protein
MMPEQTQKRRGVLIIVISAAAVLLCAGAIAIFGFVTAAPAHGPVDMKGNQVALDPGTVPPPKVQHEMNAVTATGTRFDVPSVGLDVPLGELSEAGGTITPPGFTSAYAVRNLGVPLTNAASGTVFVVMHSVRGGGVAPGNYLINVDSGTSKLPVGATIKVGALTYTVNGSQTITKTLLPKDAAIWANTAGRLVIVTCLQVPAQTASVDNLIITATLSG